MLSFKENPDLGYQVIVLFNGEKEYRKLCTKIKGEYYVKDKDCFYVDNKWLRVDSGLILKDYETNQWFLKAERYKKVEGIVDFVDEKIVKGYYTPNVYNNVSVRGTFGNTSAINAEVLIRAGYIEDVSLGTWQAKKELSPVGIARAREITNKIAHGNKGYNIEDNKDELILKKSYYEAYKTPLPTDVRRYARFLNDSSWGIEFECSHGYIPEHIQNRTGIVICHDGSLRDENNVPGPEFATIPLMGAKGLQTIVEICREAKNRTLINNKCSLHVHIGNIPTSRLFLISLYVLSFKIQEEIFKMFPHYKSDFDIAKKFLGKEKDYCKKLKKMGMGLLPLTSREAYESYINTNYGKIFNWLSQDAKGLGYIPSKEWNRKTGSHPIPQKWNRVNRYYWMNLMNMMFSGRQTAEFRIHTPTTNSQKIINWIFICNAIVRYAAIHAKEILTNPKKVSLNTILDYYKDTFKITQADFLSEYLKAYVAERTKRFKEDFEKKDYLSKWEIDGDKDYVFEYQGVKNLF